MNNSEIDANKIILAQDPLSDLSGYMKIGATGDITARAYLDCKYAHQCSVYAGLTSIWY